MAKISKNIKRLRSEKGLTQDLLAERLCISRQAVSSWENDRTQPDVDMLEKLSEVFGVSIEEIIYGKKRNTTLETEKQSYNNTLTIVFSILGALLVGVGLVLIFVTFWQDMPLMFKGILSFVPLIAGQASGLYVLYKKKDKVPWTEGGSVLWTAGIAATLTLIYNIFDMSVTWPTLTVMVALSLVPVILLLKSVTPLAVYYGCSICWGFSMFQEEESLFALAASALLVILGCVYTTQLIKAENKSHRSVFAQWLSVIAVTIFVTIVGMGINDMDISMAGLMAVAICLYMLSLSDSDMAMPYRFPGLMVTAGLMFFLSIGYLGYLRAEAYNIIFIGLCVIAALTVSILTAKKAKDKFSLLYIAIVFIYYAVYIASLFAMGDHYVTGKTDSFYPLMRGIALVAYIVMMIMGAREKKLLPINAGFIGVGAMVIAILSDSGLSMIANGFILLIFGGVLLAINFRLTKAKQKLPSSQNNEEVQDDE